MFVSDAHPVDLPARPSPQDIFRDILAERSIKRLQVCGDRDYTVEMVAYAKYLDAFIISHNTKFFLEDIPRGVLLFNKVANDSENFGYWGPTVLFKDLSERLNLKECINPQALSLWFRILQKEGLYAKCFESFKNLFKSPRTFPAGFKLSYCGLDACSSGDWLRINLLSFLLQNTNDSIIELCTQKLMPGERLEVTAYLEKIIAQHNPPPEDIFASEEKFDSCFSKDIPPWCSRLFTTEARLPAGLVDVHNFRKFHLFTAAEDISRPSATDASLRIRRVIYALILKYSSSRLLCMDDCTIEEMNREGCELLTLNVSPLWTLCDPDSDFELFELPALADIEDLTVQKKSRIFFLALALRPSFASKFQQRQNQELYFAVLMKSFVHFAEGTSRSNVILLLVSLIIVAARQKESLNFIPSIELKSNVKPEEFSTDASQIIGVKRLHTMSQLLSCMSFTRMLHYLLQEPLGVNVSSGLEEHFDELVFYHVVERAQPELVGSVQCQEITQEQYMENFLSDLFDAKNKAELLSLVNLIYDKSDLATAKQLLDQDHQDEFYLL